MTFAQSLWQTSLHFISYSSLSTYCCIYVDITIKC